jgi:hypothetical protein
MVGFILLGTGVVSMVGAASLVTGLLRTAKAASRVTEEEQDKTVEQSWTRVRSDKDAPRGAA